MSDSVKRDFLAEVIERHFKSVERGFQKQKDMYDKAIAEAADLDRDWLMSLRRTEPEVSYALLAWERGSLTYEQATYLIIAQLLRSNIQLKSILMNVPTTPPILTVSTEGLERIQRGE